MFVVKNVSSFVCLLKSYWHQPSGGFHERLAFCHIRESHYDSLRRRGCLVWDMLTTFIVPINHTHWQTNQSPALWLSITSTWSNQCATCPPNLQVAAEYMKSAGSQRAMGRETVSVCSTTLTCRIQVVGIGVVAKYWIKVDVKTSGVLWLLGRWGGCKPWWGKRKTKDPNIDTTIALFLPT